ncbi:protein-L-isoaspartate(D-aspartate) O-methyltransferase [Brackiella oedipodis]|uniref:protein-L-isoaspartate(D-aspartate) O-methyltransferase n=1 Tax=Brackiella oedipodis TaxID=124225 RepID=UPI00048BEFA5|nr:protein-L-isoaspartate(D-aspartate) O-methyltransferase [Brackiella oedipodis]
MKKNPFVYRPHLAKAKQAQQERASSPTKLMFVPRNSSTRILSVSSNADFKKPIAPLPLHQAPKPLEAIDLGLTSARSRDLMVERLYRQGIRDERVLRAMQQVPRHLFVSQGLASRAYDSDALPIGFGQTISQPWVVARMISMALEQRPAHRVLEIGTGCGYQAVVLSKIYKQVYTIERIQGLYHQAQHNIAQLSQPPRLHMSLGDGRLGWPKQAPFDAIILAAAGLEIPQALLEQLAVGGALIAPRGGETQHLVRMTRTSTHNWREEILEKTRFVPLLSGTQT